MRVIPSEFQCPVCKTPLVKLYYRVERLNYHPITKKKKRSLIFKKLEGKYHCIKCNKTYDLSGLSMIQLIPYVNPNIRSRNLTLTVWRLFKDKIIELNKSPKSDNKSGEDKNNYE